jgi:ATP-dependent DNA helicase DinG
VAAHYLAAREGKRVLLCTATLALQEQLIAELERLAEILPWSAPIAVLKGQRNYACVKEAARSVRRGAHVRLALAEHRQQAGEVVAWLEQTTTGDVAELPFVPAPAVWSKFSVKAEDCHGERCKERDRCFARLAKERATAAPIVVTNVALLCAHLAVARERGASDVLPPFDVLMIDEAHELADKAREAFGFTLSESAVQALASGLDELGLRTHAKTLHREASALFAHLIGLSGQRLSVGVMRGAEEPLAEALAGAARELDDLAQAADSPSADARALARRLRTLLSRLCEAASASEPGKVYFVELDDAGRAQIAARLLDVSQRLRAELFGSVPSVVLVSATLAVAGGFEFVRGELGVPDDAIELAVESPFDHQEQALLVLPDGLPRPNDPAFADAAGRTLVRVIELCKGRTLGLFTSCKNLLVAAEHAQESEYRVLRQGECPGNELRRRFKEDVSSVLLGTGTFWTGIDVPGEALTAVVIDRIPFPHVDDPVIKALCECDPQGFDRVILPRAITMLRQGVGRLIRSRRDVGVVVLFDRRIAEHAYGTRILDSLPPMRTTRRLENITRFLEDAERAAAE